MTLIEIFTGPDCAHCQEVKRLLKAKGIEFVEYDIGEPEHMRIYAERLPRKRSVPQIFINGQYLGNEQDFKLIVEDGRLDAIVNHNE